MSDFIKFQAEQREGARKVNECSICHKTYRGFGNNAHPLPGRCCDLCNSKIVLPMRILSMQVIEGRKP